jgi:hypothetical protein
VRRAKRGHFQVQMQLRSDGAIVGHALIHDLIVHARLEITKTATFRANCFLSLEMAVRARPQVMQPKVALAMLTEVCSGDTVEEGDVE